MTAATTTALLLAGATYALKSAGPLALGGGRRLPGFRERLALLLPAALLAALVASSAVVSDRSLTVDARLVGLAVAALALWRRVPFVVVVVLAAAVTAAVRAMT